MVEYMCEDVSNNISKGDVDMNKTMSLDSALAELIKRNEEKIKSITPVNPPIAIDDEWRNEDEWDKLYEELKSK